MRTRRRFSAEFKAKVALEAARRRHHHCTLPEFDRYRRAQLLLGKESEYSERLLPIHKGSGPGCKRRWPNGTTCSARAEAHPEVSSLDSSGCTTVTVKRSLEVHLSNEYRYYRGGGQAIDFQGAVEF
jgi:hypothetical protein